MTDLTQMIRWNAGFVRGLAQKVLDRAKVIRSSLNLDDESRPLMASTAQPQTKSKTKTGTKKITVQKRTKTGATSSAKKAVKTPARKAKR